jgi:hypothetical protein
LIFAFAESMARHVDAGPKVLLFVEEPADFFALRLRQKIAQSGEAISVEREVEVMGVGLLRLHRATAPPADARGSEVKNGRLIVRCILSR